MTLVARDMVAHGHMLQMLNSFAGSQVQHLINAKVPIQTYPQLTK